jgi:hypothetical protein
MFNLAQFGAWRPTVFTAILMLIASHGRASQKDIVINEIMYHPPLEMEDLQYLELFNRGTAPVDISDWSFDKGIKFIIPKQTAIKPGEYLVICHDTNLFSGNYGQEIRAIGNFSGRLSHRGEKIELSNAAGQVIDSVKYADTDPWPAGPDGHSSSLERINPFASSSDPANWAGSALPVFEKPAGSPGRANDSFLPKVPPKISNVVFKTPAPDHGATVTAQVSDPAGVKSVSLLWSIVSTGNQSIETELAMQRTSGDDHDGTYQGQIAGQRSGTLVRFRVKANNSETARLQPGPNEPIPTYSYSTMLNTNTARVAFAYVVNVSHSPPESRVRIWNGRLFNVQSGPTRGSAALVYMPPAGGEILTFDHVYARRRKGGLKVHFKKEHSFKGMTGVNIIFESSPRWLLSEPMAYELYRLAGVPACQTEHLRLWVDGRLAGYYLLIEQPNKAFLTRNSRNSGGSLYKVYWMYQGLINQHHKKTRPACEPDDLVALESGLTQKTGQQQWDFIQKNFNVDEFAGYYAVNMCIENWDGFFNNYYIYHDQNGTGKWEMYPWDEDKTWGDYDGASRAYDWYDMPLTYGMDDGHSRGSRNFFAGNGSWWRPPGWFSGPLLANQGFRNAFLARLDDICKNSFTEEKMLPLINAMEKRLEPEIPLRARLFNQNPREALGAFYNDIQSLRNQVKYRREFILRELPKARAARQN